MPIDTLYITVAEGFYTDLIRVKNAKDKMPQDFEKAPVQLKGFFCENR